MSRGSNKSSKTAKTAKSSRAPASAWGVEFFQRHKDDDPSRAVPGRDFLDSLPPEIFGRVSAALEAVAKAPPPVFSGGGYWKVMHDEMAGFYEVRVKSGKTLYRVFCILERSGEAVGLDGPSIVIVDGRTKPDGTAIPAKEYAKVVKLGNEFKARTPRSVLK